MIMGVVIGLLLGLAYCYWNQLQSVYQNRGLITSGGNLITDAQNFYGQLTGKM